MKKLLNQISRFRKGESGVTSTEFIIIAPLFMMMLLNAIELGVINLRQITLESRLDSAMRVVRINTGAGYTHNDIRDMICENAPLLVECKQNLRLEMVTNDPRHYTELPAQVDCVDRSVPPSEVSDDELNFTLGNSNELVIVRACLLYDPIIPTSGIALTRTADASGRSAHVAVSAFTQEPR